MVALKRIRNMLRGWKRLFKQNWTLFKASRIGLMGLAIMISFIVLALAAPFMNLRDPLWWRAPDMDIVKVTKYWPSLTANNSVMFGYAPLNHTTTVRISPAAGTYATDRIYVAAGTKLFAISPVKGIKEWVAPRDSVDLRLQTFPDPPYSDPNPVISADPVVENYGEINVPPGDFWVYVGTASGSVYAIQDTTGSLTPSPNPIRIGIVDGVVTGIAAFSGNDGDTFSPWDAVAVSTSKGKLYIWQVTSAGHLGPYNITISTKAAHIAGNPMQGTAPYPLISPAFYYAQNNRTRPFIYVGSEDGYLTSVNLADLRNLSISWRVGVAPDGMWSGAPVVRYVSSNDAPVIHSAVVFSATDDGNLTANYAIDGAYLPWWGGTRQIRKVTALRVETEKLTQPFFVPGTFNLLIGSSSGYVYSIDYLTVTAGTGPIEPKWYFKDPALTEGSTTVVAYPITHTITLAFVAINEMKGPPGHSGDVGTLFALNFNDGSQSWSVTFDSAVVSSPIAVADSDGTNKLFVGTMSGSEYAYSITGLYLIPSEPSWVKSYPSGNLYIFGLDNRGRDVFSQWVWGSRIALYVGFLAAAFSISIGTTMGLVAGYFGGKIDTVLMRFTDVILVIPGLPLIITLASVLGASVNNLIMVIAMVGWPGVARVIRSQVLSLKERPFIESAKVTGASHARIMGRHILPNILPLAFLYMTFAVSGAILSEAALSFIGLGDISTVSWGRMLQDVTQSQALRAWWWLIPPGLAITLVSLGFFLIGRAFDEIVNPRLRKR